MEVIHYRCQVKRLKKIKNAIKKKTFFSQFLPKKKVKDFGKVFVLFKGVQNFHRKKYLSNLMDNIWETFLTLPIFQIITNKFWIEKLHLKNCLQTFLLFIDNNIFYLQTMIFD